MSLERVNEEEEEIPNDGGVDLEHTVISLALIKEDVVESDAGAVEVGEVFEMLDVALVAVEAVVDVLPVTRVLYCLRTI